MWGPPKAGGETSQGWRDSRDGQAKLTMAAGLRTRAGQVQNKSIAGQVAVVLGTGEVIAVGATAFTGPVGATALTVISLADAAAAFGFFTGTAISWATGGRGGYGKSDTEEAWNSFMMSAFTGPLGIAGGLHQHQAAQAQIAVMDSVIADLEQGRDPSF
jgi:hypothetical protein